MTLDSLVSRRAAGARRLPDYALVGDIGGTNARYGLVDLSVNTPEIVQPHGSLCRDHPTASLSIAAYLERVDLRPHSAVIAVAGPVRGGAITFTNCGWSLSEVDLHALGFGAAKLMNDYSGLALAAPLLGPDDSVVIGPDVPASAEGAVAVLGPGTGFGVSALARDAWGRAVLATEGGHSAFAPVDDVEIEVLKQLRARFGRVSVERILSGPGLCNLHQALQQMDGRTAMTDDPAAITRDALAGDADSLRTVERFCAIFGSVAGDAALAYGAEGGVYLAGGIPPQILDVLQASAFRSRFEDKGRFEAYMRRIPTRMIIRPHAALLGAAQALRTMATGA